MRMQLFTIDGKELHYSDVQTVETIDNSIRIHRPNKEIVILNKKKIVKLVSYI